MKPKNKRLPSGLLKQANQSIHIKGKWKAVELDPSLFSEEGLGGLVCFEELTNYRLIDSDKAAANAAKELKKERKKKAKKRKAGEGEEAGETIDLESKEDEKTADPAKKKAKKKKKTKKPTAKESVQPGDISAEVTQEDVAAGEEAGDETAKEDAAISSEPDAKSRPAKKSNRKKNRKQKQQIEDDTVLQEQPNQESPSQLQALEKEKSTKDKVTKPSKKQQKNWTNAALSGSHDNNADVSAWKDLFVPSPVLKALSSLGFSSPTPIQALALPPAIRDRMDILGAAETGKIKYILLFIPIAICAIFISGANLCIVITGSGKTLAFGIPMIHTILEWRNGSEKPIGDKTKATTQVESLYLPAVDESTKSGQAAEPTVEEDDMEAEDCESITEQNQSDTDKLDSEDEHDVDGQDDDERLGCVQVIENAEFDFDLTTEAGGKPAGSQDQPLLGLVLTPTRELAVQVKHHIDAVAKFTGKSLKFYELYNQTKL